MINEIWWKLVNDPAVDHNQPCVALKDPIFVEPFQLSPAAERLRLVLVGDDNLTIQRATAITGVAISPRYYGMALFVDTRTVWPPIPLPDGTNTLSSSFLPELDEFIRNNANDLLENIIPWAATLGPRAEILNVMRSAVLTAKQPFDRIAALTMIYCTRVTR